MLPITDDLTWGRFVHTSILWPPGATVAISRVDWRPLFYQRQNITSMLFFLFFPPFVSENIIFPVKTLA